MHLYIYRGMVAVDPQACCLIIPARLRVGTQCLRDKSCIMPACATAKE